MRIYLVADTCTNGLVSGQALRWRRHLHAYKYAIYLRYITSESRLPRILAMTSSCSSRLRRLYSATSPSSSLIRCALCSLLAAAVSLPSVFVARLGEGNREDKGSGEGEGDDDGEGNGDGDGDAK